MAYNRFYALFLVSLLLFAASNPQVHGAWRNWPLGLSVSDQLCCTSTGNCPGQGIGGAVVSLNCTILGVSTTVGQNTTDVNGSFNITVPAITGLVIGLLRIPCVAIVQLPLNATTCPLLSTASGILTSAIRPVGRPVLTSAFGLVRIGTIVRFVRRVAS
ncbi:hypothetical protein BUALT_Bualt12G0045600 [Buddleja alternifolia]|uniref:Uncharacterized protein n=1 Tax=Buddleja alternifolia TaxID=168488 RepID=A0AAV6WVC0_9LAMI|nr:hypothetical protein BUALT_Bualt12G0045100 [Buddleja alternifolia]KAG8372237.1 hypothetical protein BUALT_Bualt12G0045600 [Buddleja alternifolia]